MVAKKCKIHPQNYDRLYFDIKYFHLIGKLGLLQFLISIIENRGLHGIAITRSGQKIMVSEKFFHTEVSA